MLAPVNRQVSCPHFMLRMDVVNNQPANVQCIDCGQMLTLQEHQQAQFRKRMFDERRNAMAGTGRPELVEAVDAVYKALRSAVQVQVIEQQRARLEVQVQGQMLELEKLRPAMAALLPASADASDVDTLLIAVGLPATPQGVVRRFEQSQLPSAPKVQQLSAGTPAPPAPPAAEPPQAPGVVPPGVQWNPPIAQMTAEPPMPDGLRRMLGGG